MSQTIELTQGKVATVDDVDYKWLNSFKWCATQVRPKYNVWRAIRACRCIGDRKHRTVYMSRQIMSCPHGKEVDHINHNTLDNRRCNLRICSRLENAMNGNKRKDNTSGFKGVCWDKNRNKWKVCINMNNRQIHLGRFENEIDAALAYDKAAKELFGEFAYTNFA